MKVGFVVAERLLYVPSVGFCFFIAIVLDHWLNPCDNVESESVDEAAQALSSSPEAPSSRQASREKSGWSLLKVVVVVATVVVIGLYSAKFVDYCRMLLRLLII